MLFYFHKCGNTNIRTLGNKFKLVESYNHINIHRHIPAYRLYNIACKKKLTKYILVRHPIKRFYSGYAHYWRQYNEDYSNLRNWIQQELNTTISNYTIDVHIEMFKKVLEDMKQQQCVNNGSTIDFYIHCVHDMHKDYAYDMQIVKLDDSNYNKKLWDTEILTNLKNLHMNQGEAYPEDELTGSNKDFIYKYYKKSCKTFGYKI